MENRTELNKECFEETLNAKIRNKLTPLLNVITLIDGYKASDNYIEKKVMLGMILSTNDDLKKTLDWLLKIE